MLFEIRISNRETVSESDLQLCRDIRFLLRIRSILREDIKQMTSWYPPLMDKGQMLQEKMVTDEQIQTQAAAARVSLTLT